MPTQSTSSTIIITGGSRGIGLAVAEKFAATGAHILLCSRKEEPLRSAAENLSAQYPEAVVQFFAADLAEVSQVKLFAQWCLQQGTPSILVNNAGTYRPGELISEPEDNLEMMMNTNLFSAYHLTRALVPSMISAGMGHIFNIASIAATMAYDGGGSYSISKFALNGLSQNLRHELKSSGVKVTCIFPGAVMTDSWAGFDNSQNRIMLASDVAEMLFAASKRSPQAVVEEILLRPQLGDL